MEFKSHLNLEKRAQLKNALLDNLSGTSGLSVESQIGYDLLDGNIKFFDNETVRTVITDKFLASTSGAGIAMFATVEEVGDGLIGDKAIAPDTLRNYTEAIYLNKNTVLPQYIHSKIITTQIDFDDPNEFVSKMYVDSFAQGLTIKQPVLVATNNAIAGFSYVIDLPDNGTPGSQDQLVFSSDILYSSIDSGASTSSIPVNGRVLVKDRADAKENGIYEKISSNILQRAADQDGSPASEVSSGNFVFIQNGTSKNVGYVLQGTGVLTINTDNLIWVQFSAAGQVESGAGLYLTGLTLNVGSGTGILVNADNIEIDQTYLNSKILHYTTSGVGAYLSLSGGKLTGPITGPEGYTSIDTVNRYLIDDNNIASIFYKDRYLQTSTGTHSVEWETYQLKDSNGTVVFNWNTKTLFDSTGAPTTKWSGTNGLSYTSDFSLAYTDRSLVDKAYVDNKFSQIPASTSGGTLYTFSNGLNLSSGIVKWGGALIQNTDITGSYNLRLGTVSSRLNNFEVNSSNSVYLWSETDDFSNNITLTQSGIEITFYDNNDNIFSALNINSNSANIFWDNGVDTRAEIVANVNGVGISSNYDYTYGYIKTTNITSNQYFELPNKSGTIALLTDIIASSTSGGFLPLNGGTMTGSINAPDGNTSIDTVNRRLYDSDGNLIFNWETGVINSSGSNNNYINLDTMSILWAGTLSANFSNRILSDQFYINSADWDQRLLIDSTGIPTTTWASTSGLKYLSDYSASYVDRSLVDKAYVDYKVSLVGNNNGSTSGILKDSFGTPSINFFDRVSYDFFNQRSVNWQARIGYDSVGTQSIRWEERVLVNASNTSFTLNWQNGILSDDTQTDSLKWFDRTLLNNTGEVTANWNSYELSGTSGVSLNWNNKQLYDSSIVVAINWVDRTLTDSTGSPVIQWNSGYITTDGNTVKSINWISRKNYDSSDRESFDWNNRLLYNSDNSITGNWEAGTLNDSNGNNTVGWFNGQLISGDSNLSIDWFNRNAYDNFANQSLDWNNRKTYDATGDNSLDWNLRNLLDTDGSIVVNWSSPTTGIVYTADFSSDYTNRSLVDKEYVDGVVSNLGAVFEFKGPYSVPVSTDFPTGANIADSYYIDDISNGTTLGTTNPVTVEIGDLIVALSDNASTTDGANWLVMQKNTTDATTVVKGVIRIATQGEVNGGTENNLAVVPSTLAGYINNILPGYATTAGNGLSMSNKTVEFGGTLYKSTTINRNNNGFVIKNGANNIADFANGILYYSTNIPSISWEQGYLIDSNNLLSVNYDNRTLLDNAEVTSINWNARNLYDLAGNSIVTWNGTSGLNYLGDYSAYFMDHTLVDKAYVKSLINNINSESTTAGNGLSIFNKIVELGGGLMKPTYINTNGYDFQVRNGSNIIVDFVNGYYNDANGNAMFRNHGAYASTGEHTADFENGVLNDYTGKVAVSWVANGNEKRLMHNDLVSLDWLNRQLFDNTGSIIANWSSPTTGIVYSNDFSATYTNRSLVDKEYVDKKVLNSSTSGIDSKTIDFNYTEQNKMTVTDLVTGKPVQINQVEWNKNNNSLQIDSSTKGQGRLDFTDGGQVKHSIVNYERGSFTMTDSFDDTGFLNAIDVVDSDTIFMVGNGNDSQGAVERSTDGGLTWQHTSLVGSETANGLFFLNATTGFVFTGDSGAPQGAVYKTTDGGDNWVQTNLTDTFTVDGGVFINSTTGYAIAKLVTLEAVLFKTVDAGDNWIQTYTFTDSSEVQDIFFLDANNGYVVGVNSDESAGNFYKTTDGGLTWSASLDIPDTTTLYSIHFISTLVGFVAGGNGVSGSPGVISKTTDGGSTWTTTQFPSTYSVGDIKFVDNNIGYAVTADEFFTYGAYLKTTDGGENWTLVPLDDTLLLISIDIYDSTAYFGGFDGSFAARLYTLATSTALAIFKDDSISNRAILTNVENPVEDYDAANKYYVDSSLDNYNFGYTQNNKFTVTDSVTKLPVQLNNVEWNSTDKAFTIIGNNNGASRMDFYDTSLLNRTTLEQINKQPWITTSSYAPLTTSNDLYFFDENNGIVGGTTIDGTGIIAKTINGGLNWYTLNVPLVENFNGITFTNSTTGYGVGFNLSNTLGTISKTGDAGTSWDTVEIPGTNILEKVKFYNQSKGFVAGVGSGLSYVIRTEDSGANWTPIVLTPHIRLVRDLEVLNATTVYVVGSSLMSTTGLAVKSTDNGTSWSAPIPLSDLKFARGVDFIDENIGFVVGRNQANVGTLAKTTDGGLTWTKKLDALTELYDVKFLNESLGYAAGSNRIYRTQDAGETWSLYSIGSGTILSIFLVNDHVGYMSGDKVIKTLTGGIANTNLAVYRNNDFTSKGMITNLALPSDSYDAANKLYVDSKVSEYVSYYVGNNSLRTFQEFSITGNNVTSSFTFTHGKETRSVQVQIFENFGTYRDIEVSVERPNNNDVLVTFDTPPAIGENFIVTIV